MSVTDQGTLTRGDEDSAGVTCWIGASRGCRTGWVVVETADDEVLVVFGLSTGCSSF
jgi:hypothetical protein